MERPSKKLVGFKRVSVPAGKALRVEIPVKGEDLAYWDVKAHAWALEKAKVDLLVGNSSAEGALTLKQTVGVGQ